MFAAIPTIAARVLPAVIRFATHRVTISAVSTAALASATSIAARTAKLQGQDKTGQRQAESIASDIDPITYADDARRVAGLKQQVGRNLLLLGQSAATEARDYRLLITPPVHLYRLMRYKAISKKVDRLSNEPGEYDEKRWQKLVAKTGKRFQSYLRVREWYDTTRVTPGEMYLSDQVGNLHLAAASHEVRVDTVEAVYLRLLDEHLDGNSINLNKPYNTGVALYVGMKSFFKESELPLIGDVLKSWLVRYQTVTNNQWKQIEKGWNKAAAGLVEVS